MINLSQHWFVSVPALGLCWLSLLVMSVFACCDAPQIAVFWGKPLRIMRRLCLLGTLLLAAAYSLSLGFLLLVLLVSLERSARFMLAYPKADIIYPQEWLAWFDVLRPMVLLLALSMMLCSVHYVDSAAAYPSIKRKQWVLIAHWPYGVYFWPGGFWLYQWAEPQLSDVVYVSAEMAWIGRVVAVAGDTVGYKSNAFWSKQRNVTVLAMPAKTYLPMSVVQKECIDGSCYPIWHLANIQEQEVLPTMLPPGTVYLLADNRSLVADSRVWGAVALPHIIGRLYCWSDLRSGLGL